MQPVKKIKTRPEQSKELKARVQKVVKSLPSNYISIILTNHPEYDSIKGGQLINNFKRFRSYDQALTEIFEKIAAKEMTLRPLQFEQVG
jgi:hypothetical protein